ncbi:MAG: hypothetical protein M0P14_03475 [Alkaliphilus sp.]|nr:hypothetical protein [Alkaliphilus sp.]
MRLKSDLDNMDLKPLNRKKMQNPVEKLIVEETINFLSTDKHAMPFDFAEIKPCRSGQKEIQKDGKNQSLGRFQSKIGDGSCCIVE